MAELLEPAGHLGSRRSDQRRREEAPVGEEKGEGRSGGCHVRHSWRPGHLRLPGVLASIVSWERPYRWGFLRGMTESARACVILQLLQGCLGLRMLRYAIQYDQVSRILRTLTGVLGVRIVVYDADDRKLDAFEVKRDSAYCRRLRQDPAFDRRCVACDRQHLRRARERRATQVYECHIGLTEGIVPLFDDEGAYLGALQFGQIRLQSRPAGPPPRPALRRLYAQLPLHDRSRLGEIASLLEYLGQYVHQNHLIRLQGVPWIDRIKDYIEEHLTHPLTIAELSKKMSSAYRPPGLPPLPGGGGPPGAPVRHRAEDGGGPEAPGQRPPRPGRGRDPRLLRRVPLLPGLQGPGRRPSEPVPRRGLRPTAGCTPPSGRTSSPGRKAVRGGVTTKEGRAYSVLSAS